MSIQSGSLEQRQRFTQKRVNVAMVPSMLIVEDALQESLRAQKGIDHGPIEALIERHQVDTSQKKALKRSSRETGEPQKYPVAVKVEAAQ